MRTVPVLASTTPTCAIVGFARSTIEVSSTTVRQPCRAPGDFDSLGRNPVMATLVSLSAGFGAADPGTLARQQLPSIMPGNYNIDDQAGRKRLAQPHRRELWRAADAVQFRQQAATRTHFPIKMTRKCRRALLAQPARPFLNRAVRDLRHARSRRAGPRRIGKHMQISEPAFVDKIERASEHRFGLGREARDDVAAEYHVGPQPPHLVAKRDRFRARVPPLHALEDEIVARLQR